jgi:hypothetical protein
MDPTSLPDEVDASLSQRVQQARTYFDSDPAEFRVVRDTSSVDACDYRTPNFLASTSIVSGRFRLCGGGPTYNTLEQYAEVGCSWGPHRLETELGASQSLELDMMRAIQAICASHAYLRWRQRLCITGNTPVALSLGPEWLRGPLASAWTQVREIELVAARTAKETTMRLVSYNRHLQQA